MPEGQKGKTSEKISEKTFQNFVERKQFVIYKRCSTEQEKKWKSQK
jgi:hypothetical protein